MKALVFVLPLALVTSVFPQAVSRNFGSVVFPGGTAATSPSITRGFGSVVFPGGTVLPYVGNSNFRRTPAVGRGTRSAPAYVYAFPVYVVGGGEKGYQFGGREGATCGVTLWPAVGRRKREEADCFLSQVGVSSLLTSGVR